jgi:hypothetical protein
MANNIVERDHRVLERETEQMRSPQQHPLAPFGGAAPTQVFGAQEVAIKRDESELLKKLRVLAAAAGEDWYYRYPVRKKVKDEETGEEKWVRDYIEGPSIKCANNVSRLYGNDVVDVREFQELNAYVFYARFIDLETGYSLTRPYRQRKSQATMKTDAQRQEDIVYQIGVSKAIRNVICNALDMFTSFAAEEAKKSIIEQVGKKLDYYREKVLTRLADMKIDVKLVEIVRGRPVKDWLATDVARTIAELQAIQDGMATVRETYLDDEPEDEENNAAPATVRSTLDKFAGDAGPPQEPASPSEPAAEPPQDAPSEAAAGTKTKTKKEEPSEAERIAHQRGGEARAKGMTRRAVPGEYREQARTKEAAAWIKGWDGEPLG